MSDTTETTTDDKPAAAAPPPETAPGQDAGTTEATFTQADVDRLIGERAKRAKEAAKNQFLEELGADSVDSIKSILEDAKKRQEAELSEVEKATALVETERKEKEALQAQLETLKAQHLASAREGVLKSALRNAGASNEEDLFILVSAKMATDMQAVFGDDATADSKQLEAFVKQVQAAYDSYFATAGAGNPSKSGGEPPNAQLLDKEVQAKIARQFGKL